MKKSFLIFEIGKLAFMTSCGIWSADIILYPFDTIITNIKANTKQFLSFKEGFKLIVAKSGIRGLYSGISTTIPCSLISSMIYFASYEFMNNFGKK